MDAASSRVAANLAVCHGCEHRQANCAGACLCLANGKDILINAARAQCPKWRFAMRWLANAMERALASTRLGPVVRNILSRWRAPAAKKPCGCAAKTAARAAAAVTRPSCIECVEKHLGAAWVLIAEHRDGYPHRLRAIGHLHEAEDESQAWPELHDAIRAARKAYQQSGTMPEFAALATMVGEARNAAWPHRDLAGLSVARDD